MPLPFLKWNHCYSITHYIKYVFSVFFIIKWNLYDFFVLMDNVYLINSPWHCYFFLQQQYKLNIKSNILRISIYKSLSDWKTQ